jgi:hypothetical protein
MAREARNTKAATAEKTIIPKTTVERQERQTYRKASLGKRLMVKITFR